MISRLSKLNAKSVKHLTAYLLALLFLAIGTGALEYVHNLQHAAEDAREDALLVASSHSMGTPEHHHDETNCAVHAQLHMPISIVGWVPLLVSLGLFVAFLSLLTPPLVSCPVRLRIACRGPPRI